jgi:SAM-dependent methyltransferase
MKNRPPMNTDGRGFKARIGKLSALIGIGPREKAPSSLTPDLRARIQASFDESSRDEEHFPSTIDPRIYHVKLIREHLGDLRGRRVLDVGCGKGRFARLLHEQEPEAELWGLDISQEMLRYVPAGIHTHAGSMTELPFADGFFDGAYATESLEHAVEIEKAVAEICRVVKPDGRIAIIDKNAGHWGKLETPEWERWFKRKELEKLLRGHCREVSSRFISYWEDVEPDGLFIAWLAVK